MGGTVYRYRRAAGIAEVIGGAAGRRARSIAIARRRRRRASSRARGCTRYSTRNRAWSGAAARQRTGSRHRRGRVAARRTRQWDVRRRITARHCAGARRGHAVGRIAGRRRRAGETDRGVRMGPSRRHHAGLIGRHARSRSRRCDWHRVAVDRRGAMRAGGRVHRRAGQRRSGERVRRRELRSARSGCRSARR
jgi:hypothetical protein